MAGEPQLHRQLGEIFGSVGEAVQRHPQASAQAVGAHRVADLGGVARAAGAATVSPLKRATARAAEGVKSSFSEGAKAGFGATGGSSTMSTIPGSGSAGEAAAAAPRDGPPDWAKRMKRHQSLSHGATIAAHAGKSGDSHGGGSSVNLSESNRS